MLSRTKPLDRRGGFLNMSHFLPKFLVIFSCVCFQGDLLLSASDDENNNDRGVGTNRQQQWTPIPMRTGLVEMPKYRTKRARIDPVEVAMLQQNAALLHAVRLGFVLPAAVQELLPSSLTQRLVTIPSEEFDLEIRKPQDDFSQEISRILSNYQVNLQDERVRNSVALVSFINEEARLSSGSTEAFLAGMVKLGVTLRGAEELGLSSVDRHNLAADLFSTAADLASRHLHTGSVHQDAKILISMGQLYGWAAYNYESIDKKRVAYSAGKTALEILFQDKRPEIQANRQEALRIYVNLIVSNINLIL